MEVEMESQEKKIYHSVYMEKSIWKRIKKVANTQKRSLNQIVVFAIKAYLEQFGG